MTGDDGKDWGFAEICAVLSERFGTRFALQNTGGNCVTLMAHLEGGIQVLITDCVSTLSPIEIVVSSSELSAAGERVIAVS